MTMTMHDTSSQLLMERRSSRLCLNLNHDHVTKRAEVRVGQRFPKSSGGWDEYAYQLALEIIRRHDAG